MPKKQATRPSYQFWPAWLGIALIRVLAWLPWPIQKVAAKALAIILYWTALSRRHVVETNLTLCFPSLDGATRREMTKRVFYNNALGFIETANGYYLSPSRLRSIVSVTGSEKLSAALDEGRGVLLLGAHFSHLDLGGALLAQFESIYCIYRPHNNPVMDSFIKKNRLKFLAGVIDRRDMRGIVRALKSNSIVWYPPDQDYGGRHAVFAPFFGVNAATITATSRLARLNNSPVLTVSYRRDGNRQHYHIDIEELDAAFPSGDDVQDAVIVNQALEKMIMKAPTQYMWTHRRFKTQPDAKGDLYR